MKTIVISGGTDGMGKATALARLRRGDNVLVVGRNAKKGQAFLDVADELGAATRATFIEADLSLVAENRRVIAEITARFPVVDALVLCARHFRSTLLETAEGLENTFALEYLSRYLLGNGLVPALEQAPDPVVINVSGPGSAKPEIRWDDLGRERDYDGMTAQFRAGRANDLLGIAFAAAHGTGPVSYVLIHPGGVATSFSGQYDPGLAAQVEAMRKFGKPVEEGIVPILARLDDPPAEPLSAFVQHQRIPFGEDGADRAAAARLAGLTRELLAGM